MREKNEKKAENIKLFYNVLCKELNIKHKL